ncbi:GNAT family N-acetyltransferase [Natronorubrum sp. JWXQ-INN-674]|uniref:GNAT family N-acetyltransferase n=1 Tax=Natronorubrum halalkaliphilum TaxID=2691917 RepID=A0A6B0VNS3_9EURY|nr:GNAT family N-acetyltransferase [Natronorubrum halalkaliphilum]MXV63461.1 GNAT family N-acetyltransferase [Natronorubrum halalkaliphilum]
MAQQVTEGTHSNHSEPTAGTVQRLTDSQTGLTANVIDTIQGMDRDRWNDVVERSEQGTVFHRYEWLEAIENALDYPARHLVVEKDTNPIGLFPNFVADIPKTPFQRLTSIYPGFGGPLLTTDVSDSLSLIVDAIPELCDNRTIVHEIRACNTNFLRYNDFLESEGYDSSRVGGRFVLNLARGYDAVFDGMTSSKRRAIRRGRETDHEIVEAELSQTNLVRFHEKYKQHMESVGGKVYPLEFFEELSAMEDRILLLQLYVEGEYAGGFFELLNDEQDTVHGFFAGVPAEYFEYHASERLYDYVFQWAIENGYDTYDFGGGGADFEDGAFQFKEEFGGELIPNIYWERGTGPTWKVVETGRSLYNRYNR